MTNLYKDPQGDKMFEDTKPEMSHQTTNQPTLTLNMMTKTNEPGDKNDSVIESLTAQVKELQAQLAKYQVSLST